MERLLIKSNGQWELVKGIGDRGITIPFGGRKAAMDEKPRPQSTLQTQPKIPYTLKYGGLHYHDGEAISHTYSVHNDAGRRIGGIDLELHNRGGFGIDPGGAMENEDDPHFDRLLNMAVNHAKTKHGYVVGSGQPGHPEFGLHPGHIADYFAPAGMSDEAAQALRNKQVSEHAAQYQKNKDQRSRDIAEGKYKVYDPHRFTAETVYSPTPVMPPGGKNSLS